MESKAEHSSNINELYSKGPQYCANYIRDLSLQPSGLDQIVTLLPQLINRIISEKLSNDQLGNWLSWLCCLGDPKKTLAVLNSKSKSGICGKVYKEGDLAYHCRECSIDESCAICEECFKNSDHSKHDWYANKTGGGCCDCGDPEAWRPQGNCKYHQGVSEDDDPTEHVADNVKHVVKILGKALLEPLCKTLSHKDDHYLYFQKLSKNKTLQDAWVTLMFNDDTHSFDEVIDQLKLAVPGLSVTEAMSFGMLADSLNCAVVRVGTEEQCREAGEILGKINLKNEVKGGCSVMLDSTVIALLRWLTQFGDSNNGMRRLLGISSLQIVTLTSDTKTKSSLYWLMSAYNCLPEGVREPLEEFFFQLMKDPFLKRQFAAAYVDLYPNYVDYLLHGVTSYDQSMLALSVQLFTLPNLTYQLVKDCDLLRVSLNTIHNSMKRVLTDKNMIDWSHQLVKGNFIRVIHHNLEYIFALETVVDYVFQHQFDAFTLWCHLFDYSQYALQETRRSGEHVGTETKGWARSLDLSYSQSCVFPLLAKRFTATVAQNMLTATEQGQKPLLDMVLQHLSGKLNQWLTTDNLNTIDLQHRLFATPVKIVDYDVMTQPVSFHIPLQRLYTNFLLAGVGADPAKYNTLAAMITLSGVSDAQRAVFVNGLLEYALRIQVVVAQSKLNLWVRNGDSIIGQAFNYRTKLLRGTMLEIDLAMIQTAAVLLHPNEFIASLLSRFGVLKFFSDEGFAANISTEDKTKTADEQEQDKLQRALIEEMLYLLINLVKNVPGPLNDLEVIKREVIHKLWIQKRTFSEIKKGLPIELKDHPDIEKIVKEVAVFKKPREREQGSFELKPEYNKVFDPFFTFYSPEEREKAYEKYREVAQKSVKDGVSVMAPPPLSLSFFPAYAPMLDVLNAPALHHVIFDILHKFTPMSLHQSVYLIQVALLALKDGPIDNDFFSLTRTFDARVSSTILSKLIELKSSSENAAVQPSIQWVLNTLSERNAHFKQLIASSSTPAPVSAADEQAERKRRAMEARQRALAQMANRQQQFESKHKDELAEKPAEEKGEEKSEGHEDEECMLCREAFDNPVTRPWGSIGLAQRSALLTLAAVVPEQRQALHRHRSPYIGPYVQLCGHNIHFDCYDKYFSSLPQRYEQMLMGGSLLDFTRGEFACPLCKRVSNVVVPYLPRFPGQNPAPATESWINVLANYSKLVRPQKDATDVLANANTLAMIRDALEGFANRFSCTEDDSEFPQAVHEELILVLSNAMSYTLSLLEVSARTSSFEQEKALGLEAPSDGHDYHFADLNAVKPKIKALMHDMLQSAIAFAYLLGEKGFDKFELLTQIILGNAESNFILENCFKSLMRLLLLSVSVKKTREIDSNLFTSAVGVIYQAQLAQSILAYNFYPDWFQFHSQQGDQTYTVTNDVQAALQQLEQIILSRAPKSEFNGDASNTNSNQADATKWAKILASTLPFLRRVALLKELLYNPPAKNNNDDTNMNDEDAPATLLEEFEKLAGTVGIASNVLTGSVNNNNDILELTSKWVTHVTNGFSEWYKSTMESWFEAENKERNELNDKVKVEQERYDKEDHQSDNLKVQSRIENLAAKLKDLKRELQESDDRLARFAPENVSWRDFLSVNSVPTAFQLWKLPKEFVQVIQTYKTKCEKCGTVPAEPALCLLCGKLCCTGTDCCKRKNSMTRKVEGECWYHSQECSRGQGAMLLVSQSLVLLFNTRSGYAYSSPYLDAHGEEDPGLKRGRPLFLDTQRYEQLKQFILSHSIGTTKNRLLKDPTTL